ncbi:hypothetical protein [Cohnella panacarvi]|uniref:hypothetical protein n=1 Tax=Cohnella panacarvi TaxID=400776 RepID=UPI0012EB30C9|nr:hypothetical protein [Cohnella panacarvi]
MSRDIRDLLLGSMCDSARNVIPRPIARSESVPADVTDRSTSWALRSVSRNRSE